MILVTGGCGFIGSNFLRMWSAEANEPVVNLDLLTYCGRRENVQDLERPGAFEFRQGDIGDAERVAQLFTEYRPRALIHFAAESHVDRSIRNALPFVRTNVLGTQVLLEEALKYWRGLSDARRGEFRFLHVSTDEVYGSLGPTDRAFTEESPLRPSSPYAASKAGADHLVAAYGRTHGLPVIITNCSNNYGRYQYPEKLIPLTILRLSKREKIPVYGDGSNIRDWLHVQDHCRALMLALEKGRPGQTYNIGARAERRNIDIVKDLCGLAADLHHGVSADYEALVEFVADRPGHDFRYAIDPGKIERELGWRPMIGFAEGLRDTFSWYTGNPEWIRAVAARSYDQWIQTQYG
jgi:dTDP-glucose 4,6-dehydratase